jgi:ADP-heptose:LPS heptosyltransferase
VILAYRALGLGDLLTGVPALRALARAHPGERLVLAAPRALAPLAELTGAVDEVVDAAPLAPLPPAVHGAALAVNLHGRGPQSHEVLLATRPRTMIAWRHAGVWEGVAAPEWRAGEHEVHRWCRLLDEAGIAADPADLDLPEPGVAAPEQARGALVVHPGAASAARRWPAERWAAVARAFDGPVLVTGGPDERGLAEAVAGAAGLPAETVLAGRTDLVQLAAVVAAAGCVASGDTGVAHLATAFGTPSVTLFGPTPPAEWGPPSDPRHQVLWNGGRGDPHGNAPDRGLLRIQPPSVLAAVERARASLTAGAAGRRQT